MQIHRNCILFLYGIILHTVIEFKTELILYYGNQTAYL